MTENEIIENHIAENIHRIEVIEDFMHSNSDADKEECSKNISVLTKINGLLQEIQQYRVITGITADDLKALEKDEIQTIGDVLNVFSEWYKYKAIGTIDEFKSLKEKSEPKKPIRKPNHDWTHEVITCPTCNGYLSLNEHHCRCGQKIEME